jgi:hypothetical protein
VVIYKQFSHDFNIKTSFGSLQGKLNTDQYSSPTPALFFTFFIFLSFSSFYEHEKEIKVCCIFHVFMSMKKR